jgi:L-alanine-DL-glutamate epimerase-like enolase superfamily enzyme
MRVAEVETFPLRWRYPAPIWDARSRIETKTSVLVKVTCHEGRVGWGEAAAFGEVPELVAAVVRGPIARLITNAEVSPRSLKERMVRATAHFGQRGLTLSAISGVEIALWDLLGQEARLPICKLLGGELKPIRVYQAAGYYRSERGPSVSDLSHDLEDRVSNRFSGLKIKVGRSGFDDDVARVRTARAALGPEGLLMVDANNAYSVREATRFADAIQKFDVHFFEEPIEFGDPAASLELRQRSSIAIAGYELEGLFSGFRPYIEARAVDVVQPDSIWSGGISECLAISDHARRHAIRLVPHNFSTIVALAANYQLLCAAENGDLLEYDATGNPLLSALAPGCYRPEGGRILGDGRPGLGLEIDERALASFRADP